MSVKLFIEFTDETGARRRVEMNASPFVIGRTPDNNLPISNSALSRKHLKIERFADVFIVSDAGSSNGSTLNDEELAKPVALRNSDKIMLGNAVEIKIEIAGGEIPPDAPNLSEPEIESPHKNFTPNYEPQNAPAPFYQSIFFIAPVFGVMILLLVSVLLFVLSDGGAARPAQTARVDRDDLPEEENRRSSRNRNSETTDESPKNDNRSTEKNEEKNQNGNSTQNQNENSNENSNDAPTNSNPKSGGSEEDTVEKFALQFLRSISSDPNAVLSSKQIALINSKIKSLKNSSAFRENLKAAGRGATSFQKIGAEHAFKPNFLAAAAIAKLGDSRGEPVATAGAIAPDLKKYANVIGLELANDVLLVTAAYAEGGESNAMRDRVANLTKTPGASAAAVRTVWFLHDNNKLDNAAFEYVVRFIAAGTILQNPQAFGV